MRRALQDKKVLRVLGRRIQNWREQYGLSRGDLAKRAEVPENFIALMERGEMSLPFAMNKVHSALSEYRSNQVITSHVE